MTRKRSNYKKSRRGGMIVRGLQQIRAQYLNRKHRNHKKTIMMPRKAPSRPGIMTKWLDIDNQIIY